MIRLIVSLCLLIFFPSLIPAQDVVLTIGNGLGLPESQDIPVVVSLSNPNDLVKSLQMDIGDVDDYHVFSGCTPGPTRAPAFDYMYNESVDGQVRILLISL